MYCRTRNGRWCEDKVSWLFVLSERDVSKITLLGISSVWPPSEPLWRVTVLRLEPAISRMNVAERTLSKWLLTVYPASGKGERCYSVQFLTTHSICYVPLCSDEYNCRFQARFSEVTPVQVIHLAQFTTWFL